MTEPMRFPHCDSRILHRAGECEYCDAHPEWQALRVAWGIAFTGHVPAVEGDRCGKLLGKDAVTGKPSVCMQAAGHTDTPHLPMEPHEALPCPADNAVARRERGDYNRWPGNQPSVATDE